MSKFIFSTIIFLLLVLNISAQESTVIPSDSVPSVTPEVSKKGMEIVLEQMKLDNIFLLREIAGIYPVILTNDSGEQICVWNDKTDVKSPSTSPKGIICECTIYQTQNRIGLVFVDGNGKIIAGAAIASWRPLPYIKE